MPAGHRWKVRIGVREQTGDGREQERTPVLRETEGGHDQKVHGRLVEDFTICLEDKPVG